MTNLLRGATAVLLATIAFPASAQWLTHPTPNLPRTADGKPNLAAPAPRGADGHPDLSGHWSGRSAAFKVPDDALTAQSKALLREREETYFRDRPSFQCQPSGPESMPFSRRIIQTPSLIIEQGALFEGSCKMIKMNAGANKPKIETRDAQPLDTSSMKSIAADSKPAEIPKVSSVAS